MQKILDTVKNNRGLFRIVSLLLTILTIILGVLWIGNPTGNYEPLISVLGTLTGLIGTPTLIDLFSKESISNNPLMSWPDAINIAIENFAKLHPEARKIEKKNTNVTGKQAQIRLFVWAIVLVGIIIKYISW
jgi:uncharacterized membrane protein HdeD (DUF308 family)